MPPDKALEIANAVREEEALAAATTQNPQLEKSVLSACLRDPSALATAKVALNDGDFSTRATRAIWTALYGLDERGVDSNPVTLISELQAAEDLKTAGGEDAVRALFTDTCPTSDILSYCEQLRNFTVAREQRRVGAQLQSLSKKVMKTAERVESTQRLIAKIQGISFRRDMLERVEDVVDRIGIEKLISPGRGEIETPWATYNSHLMGFRKGTLNLLGARPSHGKSALAMCIAVYNALRGKRCALFSLEMKSESIYLRAACHLSGISNFKAINGTLTTDEAKALRDALNSLMGLNTLFISNLFGKTTLEIELGMRRLMNDGHAPDIVIIDHVHLMRAIGKYNNLREANTEISGRLKQLTLEYGVPFLALGQLARPSGKALGERPTMDAFKESGSWEADADTVTIINRPEFYKNDGDRSKIMMYLDKNRDGRTGRLELHAEDKFFRYEEVDIREEEE